MKTLITLLALISLNAFAAKVDVMEISDDQWITSVSDVSTSYGFNLELGRAWVEVTAGASQENLGSFYREKVSGLSLIGNSIVLDIEGQQVECATIRKAGIFGKTARSTGNCRFVVTRKKTILDDGYEQFKKISYVVSIETL